MNKKDHINILWPTLIGEFYNPEHEETKNDLIKFFSDYKKKNPSKKSYENYNLYESEYNLHTLGNKTFNKLIQFIAKSTSVMSNNANKNEIENLKKKNFNVLISASWFIEYDKGGFVLPHTHGNCSWCCVYYLQLGKDASRYNGATFFQKPTPTRSQSDFGSMYNKDESASYMPEEGKLFIWPNHIKHGSIPYTGEKNRIIVSANMSVVLAKDIKTK